ncbi:hypothetical protein MCUN1_001400 [Malassezia cuniculi]|uniref:Shwachman-Bodian-Diamond syndrome protein n=1 Tax=Malassezia cuniculi TaxID=948313 RepID=A0AAF0J6H2_9BASI|nr:hypothetical protein MCUN1_001400 [Malassezia cuniculi]
MPFTNLSIIRLRKGGKRFEIACYKNKVLEWRSGVEKDLDEVVQIENVFLNVSKAQVASKEDLVKAFGSPDIHDAVIEILNKGEMQVGDKERSHELNNLWLEVATTVAQQSVDPNTQRPYTVGMIEKAMRDIHYSVKPNRPPKTQALEVIKQLQIKNTIPIERSRMRIRITMPAAVGKKVQERLNEHIENVESESKSSEWELVVSIDPGSLRAINELLESESRGSAIVETLAHNTAPAAAVEYNDAW